MALPSFLLAHGDTLQIVVFFTVLPLLALLEWLAPGRSGPVERRVRWPANLGLTALNFLALGLVPVSFVGAALWAEGRGWGLLNLVTTPAAAAGLLTLLIRGFISFGTHWLMHRMPWLWRVHRVHHLDTGLDVTTTVRFHPLEFLVGVLPGVPIVVAFGLTPWVLALYELLDVAVTLWTHSSLRLPASLDRAIRYVVVTPDLHRLHHSAWQPETDSNFGAVFPVWDLVFGTYRAALLRDGSPSRLGLDEVRGPAAHRLVWLLTSILEDPLRGQAPGALQPSARLKA
jgi:sterol desaturase/sphingolipid hydroxylase (fatty acid hydroxylase superfamily)